MSRTKYVGLAILVTFLMGVAFPVGKIGLAYAPPFFLMGIRFVLAGGVLAILVARGRPQQSHGWKWYQPVLVGLFQTTGLMGCVYYSIMHLGITSSESAILTYTNPMFVMLGTLLTGAVYLPRQKLGMPVGVLGVVVTLGGFSFEWKLGTLICICGAIFYAAATLLVKQWVDAWGASVLAAYQMLFGGLALLTLSVISEHPAFEVTTLSLMVVWGLVVGTIFQFSIWFKLLSIGDPTKASAFLFLVLIFAVLSSWLLLGEQLHWYVIVGGGMICLSVFLVNWGKTKSTNG